MTKCKYCNFDETGSYFPTKEFESNLGTLGLGINFKVEEI